MIKIKNDNFKNFLASLNYLDTTFESEVEFAPNVNSHKEHLPCYGLFSNSKYLTVVFSGRGYSITCHNIPWDDVEITIPEFHPVLHRQEWSFFFSNHDDGIFTSELMFDDTLQTEFNKFNVLSKAVINTWDIEQKNSVLMGSQYLNYVGHFFNVLEDASVHITTGYFQGFPVLHARTNHKDGTEFRITIAGMLD